MAADLTPGDLGFPDPPYSAFRPGQLPTAREIAASSTRFALLSAPPGAGKSLIYLTISRLLGRGRQAASGELTSARFRTLVLVGTKALQSQLMRDFERIGVVEVKGHGNYPCTEGKGDDWECLSDVDGRPCDYQAALAEAWASDLVVSNYAYWLAMRKWGNVDGALGKFDLVVVDEAHGVHDWVTKFAGAEFGARDVEHLDDCWPVKGPSRFDLATWGRWAEKEQARLRPILSELEEKEKDGEVEGKEVRRVRGLLRRVSTVCRAARDEETEWVVHVVKKAIGPGVDRMGVSPVWCRAFACGLLFGEVERAVLVSATLTPQTAGLLRIADADFTWHEIEEGFPVARRPFYWVKGAPRLDYRMKREDWKRVVGMVGEIVLARGDRKGIVHTRSYQRAGELGMWIPTAITVRSGRELRDRVVEFRKAKSGVLITAGLEEGWDFPYDQCRYVVILKTPFLDTRPPLVRARVEGDRSYGNMVVGETLIQMSGRGMRAADDACEVIVVDGHFNWFRYKYRWPKWFGRAMQGVAKVPEPMDLDNPGARVVTPAQQLAGL